MMRSSGAWVLVALIVGIGAGYWVGSEQREAPVERASLEGAESAPRAAVEVDSSNAPQTGVPPRSDGAEVVPAAIPATKPTLAVSAGGGKIRGRIVDQADEPIAGVLVIALPLDPRSTRSVPPGGGAPARRSLQEQLAAAERHAHFIHAGRREVRSDAAGRYQVERLAPGQYRLQAYREGYTLRAGRRSNAWRAEAGDVIDFAGEAVVLVYVDVLDPAGQVPKTATLRTSTDEEGREGRKGFGWSPERNWIAVSPGTHWLTASAGEDRELKASKQKFSAVAGADAARLTVRLVGRPGIRGRLTFAEALDADRLVLKVLKFSGETSPDGAAVLRSRQSQHVSYDRRDQHFSVQDLESGRYLLVGSYDGKRADLTRVIDVPDMMIEVELEMPAVDRGYYRIVYVIDDDGDPVPGVNFVVKLTGPRMSGSGHASSLCREDGSYYVSIRLGTGESLSAPGPDDTVRLSVSTRERGSVDCVIDHKAKGDLIIQLGDPATVDLTIEGFSESGLGDKARLYMKSTLEQAGIGFTGQGVPVTAEGRVHIPNQQAGERIAVLVYGQIQVKAFRLALKGGENRLAVRLPRLYEVRVEGAASSVQLKCFDAAGAYMHQFGRAPKEGSFLLRFVPAGRYEASSTLGDGKTKKIQFDVPAQTVIRFDD